MQVRPLSEQEHSDVVGALRRHHAQQTPAGPRLSVFQLVQLAATALLAVGLTIGVLFLIVGGAVLGAAALAFSVNQRPAAETDPLAAHFDERSGLPLASVLPIVLDDSHLMASLGGRISLLALEIGAAVELHDEGDDESAAAAIATVMHRLHSDTLLYSGTGAFSPLFFLQEPGTLVVLRRDVLGDESSYWLAERTLRELNVPVEIGGCRRALDVIAGGATGAIYDAATLLPQALIARNEARTGGPGTAIVRTADRPAPTPAEGAELVVASTDVVLGRWFGMPDVGARVGIFEQFGGLAMTLTRGIEATHADGQAPFIGVSATALANPRAVGELVSRAEAAGLRGRVGLVLPSDFPTSSSHRAVRAVSELHAAGFYVVADRAEPWSRLRPLPQCPVDAVVVGSEMALGAPTSAADRALLEAIVERQGVLVYSRAATSPEIPLDPSVLEAVARFAGPAANRSARLNEGGRSAHPTTAPATTVR